MEPIVKAEHRDNERVSLMSDDDFRQEDLQPGDALPARKPWIRPTVTKMAAADAELGTRPNVSDGSFSVS